MLRSLSLGLLVPFLWAGSATARVHTVQPGETLDGLARRYGVGIAELARTNGIGDPDLIYAGDNLAIPESRVSTVAATTTPSVRATQVAVPPTRRDLAGVFERHAADAGVPAKLVMALAWQESGWQTKVVSPVQAIGVMQLMPDTVAFASRMLLGLPVTLDPSDPDANIRMGTRFVAYLLDRCGGDVPLALAAYYQGLRSVREDGVYEETHHFVANVLALQARF